MTSPGEELRAVLHARKDLGPEYEESLIESFLEKVDHEIERRVDSRLAREEKTAQRTSPDDGRRLTLAVISVVFGAGSSIVAIGMESGAALFVIWIGIAIVNVAFMIGGQNRPPASRRAAAPSAPESRRHF